MRKRWPAILIVVTLAWGGLAATLVSGLTPKLGLDLRGGTSVLLEAPEGTELAVAETAVEVMRRRIEDFGSVQEPEISISENRNGRISVLVQLPGVTDQERALEAIGQTGQLSFRPVLAIYFGAPSPAELASIPRSVASCTDQSLAGGVVSPPPVVDEESGLTKVDDLEAEVAVLPELDDEGNVVAVYAVGPAALTGSDVARASSIFVQQWTVQLSLTGDGADKFADITGELANRAPSPQQQMAIVLDGVVVSSPVVRSSLQEVGGIQPCVGIEGGNAVITVGGTEDAQDQAQGLATVLRYGSLPVSFERSSVQKVSATLGADSLQAGLLAGLGGLTLVILFLLVYYRALGLVTLVGLSIFGSLLLTLFGLLGRFQGLTLTLAGVAGVIVSIGITSDSYIVYFERIKEELGKGLTLEEAVDVGFKRVYKTILTADFVSLIGAGILFALAVGPVKGFAQALGIATVLDVFVAYYFTRNAVSILASGPLAEGGRFSIMAAAGGARVSREVSP